MCGLFGWQLSPEAMQAGDVTTLAAILAMYSERRGDDSWGVALRNPAQVPAVTVLKNIGSIKKTCRIRDIVAAQVIGHTRKATTGKVTMRNAHPFQYGNIIGAHNGFVFQHEQLNKEYKRECQVDSEHLIAHLAEERPLSDLSGVGTVSYLNMTEPDTVFLGRGPSSDLIIAGIGPRNKPIGIVWCSISMWLDDALEMAGFHESFNWPTTLRRLYRLVGYSCYEEGEFTFGSSHDYGTRNYTGQHWSQGTSNQYTGCRGQTAWDEYNANKEARTRTTQGHTLIKKQSVSKSELGDIPPHLKKNPEKPDVEEGQGKKAAASDVQCMACGDWGRPVSSYEENVDGILYFACIDEDLCFFCATTWSEQTGYSGRTSKLVVPQLKLTPLTKEATPNAVAMCHSAANVSNLNKE